MKHRAVSVVVLIVLLCTFISPIQATQAQNGLAKWTLMIYIAANNDLEPASIVNLMEMAAVGSTADVNIVVQITRPPDYKGFYGEWGDTGGLRDVGSTELSCRAIRPDYVGSWRRVGGNRH